jgi:hypothetical protein
MTMPNSDAVGHFPEPRKPTPAEQLITQALHEEFLGLANRAGASGASPGVVLAALASAACDIVAAKFGPDAVAPWFEREAEIALEVAHRMRGGGRPG